MQRRYSADGSLVPNWRWLGGGAKGVNRWVQWMTKPYNIDKQRTAALSESAGIRQGIDLPEESDEDEIHLANVVAVLATLAGCAAQPPPRVRTSPSCRRSRATARAIEGADRF